MPDYFTTDADNCDENIIWDTTKTDAFYDALLNGQGSKSVQEWYNSFDKIAETIIFNQI